MILTGSFSRIYGHHFRRDQMFRRIHPAVGFGVRRRRRRDEVVSDRRHRLSLRFPTRVGSSPGRTTRSGQVRFSGMVRPVPVLPPDLDESGRDG